MGIFSVFLGTEKDDLISAQEQRMAEVARDFHRVVQELPPALTEAEQLVERLKDIRQELANTRIMKEAGDGQAQEAQAHPRQ